ncbi:MAG: hypothetical protein ACFFDN_41465 [Candidatus Hodarchaeota archaeon]
MNNDHLSLLDIQEGDSEYRGMKDEDWNLLLRRIKEARCTPFLGAGSCSSYLTLSNQIAQELAKNIIILCQISIIFYV